MSNVGASKISVEFGGKLLSYDYVGTIHRIVLPFSDPL